MLLSIVGFLVMLAPLVIFHELGHFLFAKLFNVKAEAFSIGFGPRIWKRQIGETEWRVSAIPLGGYVKLLGEDPEAPLSPEDAKRSLQKQAPWKRFFIFFGGPLFNFIWAILVYAAIMAIGEPQMASQAGRVLANSPAEKAGFVSGDWIRKVDGVAVQKYEDVTQIVEKRPDQAVAFEVERTDPATGATKTLNLTATPTQQDGYTVYGEPTRVGEIVGLLPTARSTQVGISNLDAPAGKSGLRTGDLLVSFAGAGGIAREISTWEELDSLYRGLPETSGFTLKAKLKRPGAAEETKDLAFVKPKGAKGLGADLGLFSSEMFIDKTIEKSPAEAAGLKAGDRIVSIGGKEMLDFFQLKDTVQKLGESGAKIEVLWEREGKLVNAAIVPKATTQTDAVLKKSVSYTIGIMPQLVWAEPKTIIERTYNPLMLAYHGTERMLTFTYRNFVSIKKMFTGDVSVNTLGGPILIGKIAGESLSRGLVAFLSMMAILSIGLGVLNILPVPVLDGGHILLLLIEVVRRKPLSMRQLEIVQTVGLSIIGLLMFVVLKNDFARLTLFN